MALHFHVCINRTPIAFFSATRTSGGADPDDINTYAIELHDFQERSTRNVEVTHRYGDPAEDLILTALHAIKETK